MTAGRALFDPESARSEPERLVAERATLLREYGESGGARREEIDRRLIAIAARLKALSPRAPSKRGPEVEHVYSARTARPVRDGRMLATGDRA